VQWSWVEASAGATNWYGSARQTTGYSDARARRGDWAFSEPTPQLAITGSRADSSEASTEMSAQHNQISQLGHWQCTQPPRCADSPQLHRDSDHRFDAPAKPVGRQQIPHCANPHLLQPLGFEDMILLRTGGLAASPPVRYTLETAGQCLAATVALLGSDDGRSQIAQRCQIHAVRSATVADASHGVPHDYWSAGLRGYPSKNAVSTVDGQMQSSRPPSGPVRNPWTAPGGMKTNVPGPTPSAGAVPV